MEPLVGHSETAEVGSQHTGAEEALGLVQAEGEQKRNR
jgi:hypothetical protein